MGLIPAPKDPWARRRAAWRMLACCAVVMAAVGVVASVSDFGTVELVVLIVALCVGVGVPGITALSWLFTEDGKR